VIVSSVCLSFCINRITDVKRGNGRGRHGQLTGDPVEVINFWWWSSPHPRVRVRILDHLNSLFIFFMVKCGIFGRLLAFLIYNINRQFVPYLAKWLTPMHDASTHNILGQIWQTLGPRLIRKSGFVLWVR